MPSLGIYTFCGAVHICPVYSANEKAILRATALKSPVESSTIWFTPAFSVYTCACRACCSSQSPLAVLPVKSMSFTSGRRASFCAVSSPAVCATRVTTFGSKPASVRTSRAICTVIASGRIAFGCGLTITALPVARLANIPGYPFQVGNVLQPITRPTPRGTMRKCFSIFSGSFLPCGFSQ